MKLKLLAFGITGILALISFYMGNFVTNYVGVSSDYEWFGTLMFGVGIFNGFVAILKIVNKYVIEDKSNAN